MNAYGEDHCAAGLLSFYFPPATLSGPGPIGMNAYGEVHCAAG